MQDRFKYRCWHKPTKTMYEVFEFNKTFIKATPSFVVTSIRTIKTEDCILIQCTGLKDKNNKLIYEGDIVKTITHNLYEEHIGVIRYHTCYFSLDYKEVGKFGECGISLTKNTSDFVALEMLGDIYENPELIGGAK